MGTWQQEVLALIGAKWTAAGTRALTLWAQSEGMTPSYHNPLATTLGGYGGHSINSAGVQSYPTWPQGERATAATLGASYYVGIVAALKAGNTLYRIWAAINASPWCNGCQKGHYPIALWNVLGKSTPGGPPPPPPPPVTAAQQRTTAITLAQRSSFDTALHNWVMEWTPALYQLAADVAGLAKTLG